MKIPAWVRPPSQALKDWVDILSKIAAISILFAGVYKYFDSKEIERVLGAQNLLDEYYGSVETDRKKISEAILEIQPELEPLAGQSLTVEDASIVNKGIVWHVVRSSLGGRGIERELQTTLTYFDRVAICVEQGLCDEKTIQVYLQGDVEYIFENFSPYVSHRRQKDPNFAVYAEKILRYKSPF